MIQPRLARRRGRRQTRDRSTDRHDAGLSSLYDGVVYALTAFGLAAVSAMLVCYAFEDRSPWWVLGFGMACSLGSIYGFFQGAWPFGVVEAVWTVVAVRRWWRRRKAG